MGDDGFGPAVVEHLQREALLPPFAQAVDAGTGVREYLFDYLLAAETRPQTIVIIDAVDFSGRQPGEVFQIRPCDIPVKKIHDFSLHQFPTVNLLAELEQNTGVRVVILAGQVLSIPEEIAPGLSPPMTAAITTACAQIAEIVSEHVYEVNSDDV